MLLGFQLGISCVIQRFWSRRKNLHIPLSASLRSCWLRRWDAILCQQLFLNLLSGAHLRFRWYISVLLDQLLEVTVVIVGIFWGRTNHSAESLSIWIRTILLLLHLLTLWLRLISLTFLIELTLLHHRCFLCSFIVLFFLVFLVVLHLGALCL